MIILNFTPIVRVSLILRPFVQVDLPEIDFSPLAVNRLVSILHLSHFFCFLFDKSYNLRLIYFTVFKCNDFNNDLIILNNDTQDQMHITLNSYFKAQWKKTIKNRSDGGESKKGERFYVNQMRKKTTGTMKNSVWSGSLEANQKSISENAI